MSRVNDAKRRHLIEIIRKCPKKAEGTCRYPECHNECAGHSIIRNNHKSQQRDAHGHFLKTPDVPAQPVAASPVSLQDNPSTS